MASPLLLGKGRLPWSPAPQQTITGLVYCDSGRAVANIWIAEETGVGLYATRTPNQDMPSATAYRAAIPKGVAYQLHVGCGGTAQHWGMSASSKNTTAASLNVHCDDIAGETAYQTCKLVTSPAHG
ncbi:hypothetical protein [Catenulispora sp. MAP12-49]|uniref:hypothetical protein n=1 Tax=Catenulispora sp. MAP12-49 TaxID=3156302 RepID=UPI003512DF69